MIRPVAQDPRPIPLSQPFRAIRSRPDRPIESLAAPRGTPAELEFHHGLVAAAEQEFTRLLLRIEPLLLPLR